MGESEDAPPPGSRFLFYTNECVGLGHLRRTMNLAEAVAERAPTASALVVTGAAAAVRERAHPRIDTVKLPVLSRVGEGGLQAARLGIDPADLHALRSRLAVAVAESFRPHVAVVDKTPFGLNDELVGALEALRASRDTRLVLGLRDVEDAPELVRQRWSGSRLRDRISRFYDTILVYGPRPAGDMLDCLALTDLDVPVHHVGYVGSPLPTTGPVDLEPGYLLLTAGGGVDGYALFDAVLRSAEHRPLPLPAVMVTGPLMASGPRAELTARAAALGIRVFDARDDMEAVIVGSRAVVAMAGYNTVSEVVRAGKPLLLIPREGPSREQLVRAEALAAEGLARMLPMAHAMPATVAAALAEMTADDPPARPLPSHGGAARTADILCELAAAAQKGVGTLGEPAALAGAAVP